MTVRTNVGVRISIAASLALFGIALGLPALEFATHEPVRGYDALLWGWWGLFTGDFPWVANILYFLAIPFAWIGKRNHSLILAAAAFATGLLSLRVHAWWFNEGSSTPVQALGPAFYFWMASFVVLFVGVLFSGAKSRGSRK